MQFINLTPHDVVIDNGTGGTTTFPPSGGKATLVFEPTVDGVVDGFIVRPRSRVREVTGLQPAQDGVLLIVSTMVRDALAGVRSDLITPDSGPDATRAGGQVVSVRRFIR